MRRRAELIQAADDPRVAAFRDLAGDRALRGRDHFVVESRTVVERVLRVGRHPLRALLSTPAAHAALAPVLAETGSDCPVFVAEPVVLDAIIGFRMQRGCVAFAERGAGEVVEALVARLAAAKRAVLVLENVADADNLGAIFRNAAVFGVGGVLLSPGGSDPHYRKAIRVSMGASLEVPHARLEPWPAGLLGLREAGFRLLGLSPHPGAVDLHGLGAPDGRPLALLLGSEGPGLSAEAAARCELTVRIPMRGGADSLNVASASAIALDRLVAS